mmetsp:Transcript_8712/g.39542  ORF Transcript_8712/g.39542 Transcript_8712/m.39542 type:complete len:226 (-) Transcript_8712:71-748(-)
MLADSHGDARELVIVRVRRSAVDVYVLKLALVLVDEGRIVWSSKRQPHVLVKLRSLHAEKYDGQVHPRGVERKGPEPLHVRRDVETIVQVHGKGQRHLAVRRPVLLARVVTVPTGKHLVVFSLAAVEPGATRQPRTPDGFRHRFHAGGETDHAVVRPVHLYVRGDLERLLALVRDNLPLLELQHKLNHRRVVVILGNAHGRGELSFRGRERAFVPREIRVVPWIL